MILISNRISSATISIPASATFPRIVSPQPDNYNEITERLGEPRASLLPSRSCEETFDRFVRTNSRALNEDAVMSDVFPAIRGLDPRAQSFKCLPTAFWVISSLKIIAMKFLTLKSLRRSTQSLRTLWSHSSKEKTDALYVRLCRPGIVYGN